MKRNTVSALQSNKINFYIAVRFGICCRRHRLTYFNNKICLTKKHRLQKNREVCNRVISVQNRPLIGADYVWDIKPFCLEDMYSQEDFTWQEIWQTSIHFFKFHWNNPSVNYFVLLLWIQYHYINFKTFSCRILIILYKM